MMNRGKSLDANKKELVMDVREFLLLNKNGCSGDARINLRQKQGSGKLAA